MTYNPNTQPRFTPTPPQEAGWPQQPQYGGPPPQPPKKKHTVRNVFLIIAGVFVLLIIISVAVGGGGSKNTPAAATSPSASSKAAAPAKAAAAPKAAGVGTAVRDGKFQFTITSVSQAKTAGDTTDGLGDTAQGEYTILHVTVTNIGSEPQTLDDSAQYVYDASGRKYDASTDADLDLNSSSGADSVFLNDINPGNTVKGQIAFDMPTGTKAVKAELHDSAFSGGVTVNLP
ncbi:MAG TPA: DUF4352 domain-containing protein [Trebonia sp.]|nr:DUF4352 domain-containing protein [Trebonia sp.]